MPSGSTNFLNPFPTPSPTFPAGAPGSPSGNTLPSQPSFSGIAGPTATTGGLFSGGGGSSGAGNAAGFIAPLLFSLLAPGNQQASAAISNTDQLSQMAKTLFGQGQDLTKMGTDALGPVLKYLQAVVGGNPAALSQATMPERARLIDFYDTAKTSAQFSPRGGGQAGAYANVNAREASDLASTTANARQQGVAALGSLGSGLTSAGQQSEAAGNADLNAAITQQEQQAARQDNIWASIAMGLGKAAATYFTGGAAAPLFLAQ